MTKEPQNIFVCIASIVAEMPAVGKSQTNTLQKYKYRGIEDVIMAAKPLLARYGVFVVPTVLRREQTERTNDRGTVLFHTHLDVEHTFYAKDGTFVKAVTTGEAIDSSDKSCNKAMTAALKYALNEVLFIASEDAVDTETEHHEASHPQKKTPATAAGPLTRATTPLSPAPISEPGDYVITIGKKYAGKKLSEVSPGDLRSFAQWLDDQARKEDKPLSKAANEYIYAVMTYLNQIDEENNGKLG